MGLTAMRRRESVKKDALSKAQQEKSLKKKGKVEVAKAAAPKPKAQEASQVKGDDGLNIKAKA